MKDALNDLQGKLPSGDRLYSLLAACTIAAIIVAYGLIAARGLVPSIRAWMDLSAQVAAADAALAKAREAQALAPGAAERRRAAAEAALAQAAGILLSEGQAAEMPTRLYEYAGASGVEIVSLQSQPVQKGAADDVYSVRVLDVQIAGPLAGLIHCLSRIDEGALPGCVISGVSIVEHGDAKHLLRMAIVAYTSPHAAKALPSPTASVPPATAMPMPTPSATPPPTATPPPEPVVYTVRGGDTLYSLARRYGTSVEAIMAANDLGDTLVRPGQRLIIPSQP